MNPHYSSRPATHLINGMGVHITPLEVKLLDHLAQGGRLKTFAFQHQIRYYTLTTRLNRMCNRLGFTNNLELMYWWGTNPSLKKQAA